MPSSACRLFPHRNKGGEDAGHSQRGNAKADIAGGGH